MSTSAADFNRTPERFALALKTALDGMWSGRIPTINDVRVVLWIWFNDEGPPPERPNMTVDEYALQWGKYFNKNFNGIFNKGPLLKPKDIKK